ncbi:hypothetical protein FZ103_00760 [Streptomonospora sp. PA3]|uniref:hypothetical protein n=1 Tax=Streptomonospora sp. PA3 TaxID=2607326 RepID=UPI0012DC7324|nr:hypothetical protein [Streptomonospora sp. PA3]MUL39721.1 hypothetical protein [Streptomonospora sp. PA3]
MTQVGTVLAAAAAIWFTEAGLRGAVCGSLLLGAVLGSDLLARRLRGGRRDRLDVWLALVLGRLREYVVFAGLAIGGTAAGVADAWAWAAGALIALALRDSVAAARRADAGEPEWTPESGLPRPIDAVDPSRHPDDASAGDASLTAELLGRPPGGCDDGGAPDGDPGAPSDIRTVPKGAPWPGWSEGRAEILGDGPAGPEDSVPAAAEGPADVADGGERPADRAGTDRPPSARASRLLRLAAFPQGARFAVVALTITIWDARVTFIALIVGCALAVTAELAGGPDHETAR